MSKYCAFWLNVLAPGMMFHHGYFDYNGYEYESGDTGRTSTDDFGPILTSTYRTHQEDITGRARVANPVYRCIFGYVAKHEAVKGRVKGNRFLLYATVEGQRP
eukprot:scaffold7210_cov20-Prasinocladus_malaysianus.AAC.1